MDDQLVLKNRLKVARAERSLSQGELAKLVGVSRQTISSIETGQFNPTAKLALVICVALDKKFEEKLQPIYVRLDNVEHRLDNADIRFDKIESRLDSLEVKQDRTIKKLNDFQLDTQVALRDLARGLHKLQDEMETVIEILKMNAMVPQ